MTTNGNMTIFCVLQKATEILKQNKTIETPRLDAEVLLCCVLNCERIFLVINSNKMVEDTQYNVFFSLVERRAKNEPISYLTGKREFMSLDFLVKPGVLIPRPDTEVLVEKIIEIYKGKQPKIIDICCGSGAIAVSLGHYIKNSEIYALDKYDVCVNATLTNAEINNVNINVINSDIFDDIQLCCDFDCVVSNPPYIKNSVLKTLSSDVKDFEPQYALDGGNDGLDFYKRITDVASAILKNSGVLAYEIGFDQADDVCDILYKKGCFHNIEVLKDLSGLDRVIIAERR